MANPQQPTDAEAQQLFDKSRATVRVKKVPVYLTQQQSGDLVLMLPDQNVVISQENIEEFVQDLLKAAFPPLEERIHATLSRMTEELSCLNSQIHTYIGKISRPPYTTKSAGQ